MRRKWQPTPLLLLGKSHEQRNLEGCSPWARKKSDVAWQPNNKQRVQQPQEQRKTSRKPEESGKMVKTKRAQDKDPYFLLLQPPNSSPWKESTFGLWDARRGDTYDSFPRNGLRRKDRAAWNFQVDGDLASQIFCSSNYKMVPVRDESNKELQDLSGFADVNISEGAEVYAGQ